MAPVRAAVSRDRSGTVRKRQSLPPVSIQSWYSAEPEEGPLAAVPAPKEISVARDFQLAPIPEIHWKWWFWCACRVQGQTVKRVNLGGGTYEDRPVPRLIVRNSGPLGSSASP